MTEINTTTTNVVYTTKVDAQALLAPTVIPEAIERMADERYKVVPSHESMFHRWAVVAGGTQQLYLGREVECQNMARKFAGAFLDGAFVAMQHASHGQASAQADPADIIAGALQISRGHAYELMRGAVEQAAPAYKDSTPELHIGDSAFESWYSTYSPVHKSDKQRARDAYAAGMGDPLVTAAPSRNLEQELAMLIRRLVSSARRNCEDGSNVLKLANEAWAYLVRKGLNGSPLRDAGIESDPTPAAQAADSVLEDAARWQEIRSISGSNIRVVDIETNTSLFLSHADAAVDAARAAQETLPQGKQ